MVYYPESKNPPKNPAILAAGYIIVMVFLFTGIYSGQVLTAITLAGFTGVVLWYCYRQDLVKKTGTGLLKKPLFLTALYGFVILLIASFFTIGMSVLIRHGPDSPRYLLFWSFLTLPVFLFFITRAINPRWIATDAEKKGSYQESFVLPHNYAKVFDLCLRSVQPPFREYELYSADRVSGIIRAGNLTKSLGGHSGRIVVTITIEKIEIGSTRVTLHGINPNPHRIRWIDGPLCEDFQPTISAISDFIRQQATGGSGSTEPGDEWNA